MPAGYTCLLHSIVRTGEKKREREREQSKEMREADEGEDKKGYRGHARILDRLVSAAESCDIDFSLSNSSSRESVLFSAYDLYHYTQTRI